MQSDSEELCGVLNKEGNSISFAANTAPAYARGAKKCVHKGVLAYNAICTRTGEQVEWIEIACPEHALEQKEEVEETVQLIRKSLKKFMYLPKVYAISAQKEKVVLVHSSRGDTLEQLLEKNAPLEENTIRTLAQKMLICAIEIECMSKKAGIDIENTYINAEGGIYMHSPLIWKEILDVPLEQEQTSEERMYKLGICLLALGVGKYPRDILQRYAQELSEKEQDLLQQEIVKWVSHITLPCYKEVVLSAFGSLHSARQIEELQTMHFFYPDDRKISPCTCSTEESDQEEDSMLLDASATETIHDHQGGVTVKARTLSKDTFSFQMHFFNTSKKVTFSFNKNEDTVEDVVKEMEDEGLAEERQVELIKAHMEKLIDKIEVIQTVVQLEQEAHAAADQPISQKEEINDCKCEYLDTCTVDKFAKSVAEATNRTESTAETWAAALKSQDIKTVGDLRLLVEEDWEMMQLPVFASRAMKNALFETGYCPIKEKMLSEDETLQAYESSRPVEDLLADVANRQKRPELLSEWLQKVKCQDIRTVGEMKILQQEDWEHLDLSVFAYRVIRNAVFRQGKCIVAKTNRKEE